MACVQKLVDPQLTVNGDANWVFTEYWSSFDEDVDQDVDRDVDKVLIEMSIEYRLRVSIDTWLLMPLVRHE